MRVFHSTPQRLSQYSLFYSAHTRYFSKFSAPLLGGAMVFLFCERNASAHTAYIQYIGKSYGAAPLFLFAYTNTDPSACTYSTHYTTDTVCTINNVEKGKKKHLESKNGGGKIELKRPIDLQITKRVESSQGAFAHSSQLVVAQIPANQTKKRNNK